MGPVPCLLCQVFGKEMVVGAGRRAQTAGAINHGISCISMAHWHTVYMPGWSPSGFTRCLSNISNYQRAVHAERTHTHTHTHTHTYRNTYTNALFHKHID